LLTAATWNLQNFFRPGGDAAPTSEAAYHDKLTHIKATIEAIDPDVSPRTISVNPIPSYKVT
jgi:hypothetical protein